MKNLFSVLFISFILSSCTQDKALHSYVNPFVGTGGHGHTFPGATMPFGMVQLSPDSRLEGWDGCGGYHYSDSIIYGFSHTHLSGTGVSDYGDILLAPTTGAVHYNNGADGELGYSSKFSHENESAHAGFYQVFLEDYAVDVALTASKRVGFHQYTFPKTEQANVILDLEHRDEVLESEIHITGTNEVVGFRRSKAWATDQHVYFVAQFSKDFKSATIAQNDIPTDLLLLNDKELKASFEFETQEGEQILVKVAISAVSIASARKNLEAEIPHWDFNKTQNESEQAWNKELSKIDVDSDEDTKHIFYTALYHSCIAPNIFSDVDGSYRGTDLEIHHTSNSDNYTVFSLWDTYRATHPLFTIIDQKRTTDFINTFINQYEIGGQLPVWELAGTYTGCMIGYHSVPVIVDAYKKGITGFDVEKVYEAMLHSAEQTHLGLASYHKNGFITANDEPESVSKTLEYAYDDWCIAQMAKDLGKEEDYIKFMERAQSYKNVFDPNTGFMRAKMNHSWFVPFDPSEVNYNYTEANSWQYSFYVPQDISGLTNYFGGKEKLEAKLDELFTASSETAGRHQADITGLIGQYAHGNEPSHHMAYLYNYVNKPWKSQERVSQILKEMYSNAPDGLSGNEDCGQMSSWYVLSAMGIYPVTPGLDYYTIGSPRLEKASINLENGNQFQIIAKGASEEFKYIQSASLNGKAFNRSYIYHSEIMDGGTLEFVMTNTPNENWAAADAEIPVSTIEDAVIVAVPYIDKGDRTFTDSNQLAIKAWDTNAKIYYSLDGSKATVNSILYTEEFTISESLTLKAIAVSGGVSSKEITAEFTKIPKGRSIELFTEYGSHYSAGGDKALIDHLKGAKNYMTGSWQGYQGVNVEAIVDLNKITSIKDLSIGFLQDWNAWIFMPESVEYYASNDGKNFTKLGSVLNLVDERESGVILQDFSLKTNTKTRYIKVIAKNRKYNPEWHRAPGDICWIFADEISIN
ncbi:MAG: GH92 family glycosyl hydrolase [Flavobacteriales bacterium]|jgi:predicted alpha-1,2-mannosidase